MSYCGKLDIKVGLNLCFSKSGLKSFKFLKLKIVNSKSRIVNTFIVNIGSKNIAYTVSGYPKMAISNRFTVNLAQTLIKVQSLI